MILVEKIVKHLSQLNEMFSNLEKKSVNVISYITILEDLHSLLNESTYKGNIDEIELRVEANGNENHIDEGFYYVEDYINSTLKYQLEKDIDTCFEACQHIYSKQTSSLLKKTWQYIKIFLFDNPEDILASQNVTLLQRVLNVRLELKEKNFAIFYEEINQARAQQQYNKKNKRISNQDYVQSNQKPQQKMNTVYTLKNKNHQSAGDIIDERSQENQLSFETPLPPDANSKFKNLGQFLKDKSVDSHPANFFSNQKKNNEGPNENQKSEKKRLPENLKYKLEPQTNPSLLSNKDDQLQEVGIVKNITFDDGMSTDDNYSYKDLYSFKRCQYTDLLNQRQQDQGRISRNHASLRVKIDKITNQIQFYLVNHSPNGCSVQKDGTNQWIRVKDVGQEIQIFENDTIGILFDVNDNSLLIGYKFQLIQ